MAGESHIVHGWLLRSTGSTAASPTSGEPPRLVVEVRDAAAVAREAPAGRLMVAEACLHDAHRPYALVESADEYVLRNFGFFEAHIAKALDHVICWADPSVPEEMVPVLVTGNLCNFVMWLAGDIGLHASSVVHDDALIVVMGARNMGKSTTAAALAGAGCAFFGDDLLRVTLGSPIRGHRGTMSARLRRGAWSLGESASGALTGDVTVDGRRNLAFAALDDHASSAVPIGVVVVPRIDRGASGIEIEPVAPSRAVEWYHRLARINGVNDARLVSTYLDHAVALAQEVPMVIATIPYSPDTIPALGRDLLAALTARRLVGVRR